MVSRLSSLRLSEDLKPRLAKMAKQQDRSVNYLINVAVSRMLSENEIMIQSIHEGLGQLEAGCGISHEEVVKRSQAIISQSTANSYT